jgi:hypothetical protein
VTRPRLLLIALLAWTLCASALAEGNRTLTCSVNNRVMGCMIEQPAFVLGALEVAVGVDAQLAWRGGTSHLAPYLIAGWYASTWAVWGEFHLPEIGIPTVGRPDFWRLGFTVRF